MTGVDLRAAGINYLERIVAQIANIEPGCLFLVEWGNEVNDNRYVGLCKRLPGRQMQMLLNSQRSGYDGPSSVSSIDRSWSYAPTVKVIPIAPDKGAGWEMLTTHGKDRLADKLIGDPWAWWWKRREKS